MVHAQPVRGIHIILVFISAGITNTAERGVGGLKVSRLGHCSFVNLLSSSGSEALSANMHFHMGWLMAWCILLQRTCWTKVNA